MAEYRPQLPFSVPIKLLIPAITTVKGITKKTFPNFEDGELFYGSFKTYGGTETTVNDVYVVKDTAIIETWYRPDIKADCRIALRDTETYEILGEPENINLRNKYLKFKVQRIKGGA